MENVRKNLEKELDTIQFGKNEDTDELMESIASLCYSADETAILNIAEEDAIIAWKIVEIARKYKGNLPRRLKM